MISGLKTKMSEVKVELIKMIKLIVLLGKISKEDICKHGELTSKDHTEAERRCGLSSWVAVVLPTRRRTQRRKC